MSYSPSVREMVGRWDSMTWGDLEEFSNAAAVGCDIRKVRTHIDGPRTTVVVSATNTPSEPRRSSRSRYPNVTREKPGGLTRQLANRRHESRHRLVLRPHVEGSVAPGASLSFAKSTVVIRCCWFLRSPKLPFGASPCS